MNMIIPQTFFNQEIFIKEIRGTQERVLPPIKEETLMQLKALSITIIEQGEMNIEVNQIPYLLTKGHLLETIESHLVEKVSFSKDFIGYQLIIKKEFVEQAMNTQPYNIIPYDWRYPSKKLLPEELNILLLEFQRIKERIESPTEHRLRRLMVINAFSSFMLELANIYSRINNEYSFETSNDKITKRFFQLIAGNVRKKHNVIFYANELCISPDYLSRVLKATNGHNATQWLTEALMIEAKKLLRHTDTSIQQIADELNFSDQSTFGKFFKRYCGKSPIEWRKENK
ncbi:helix-turn-helix domain-containing protein [Bacteroides ihuae]|uniref:helix-turn-helix domain-containing protein n=1 Tax=Bacteroides ihuae TaxID=1852362 RepID=UPI0008D9ADEB|nr:helix-turn-helix domain-containing protein [Bacteroides ihuae]